MHLCFHTMIGNDALGFMVGQESSRGYARNSGINGSVANSITAVCRITDSRDALDRVRLIKIVKRIRQFRNANIAVVVLSKAKQANNTVALIDPDVLTQTPSRPHHGTDASSPEIFLKTIPFLHDQLYDVYALAQPHWPLWQVGLKPAAHLQGRCCRHSPKRMHY